MSVCTKGQNDGNVVFIVETIYVGSAKSCKPGSVALLVFWRTR